MVYILIRKWKALKHDNRCYSPASASTKSALLDRKIEECAAGLAPSVTKLLRLLIEDQ